MPRQDGVDRQGLKASLSRLWDIYKDMSDVASEVSTWRCPYKDRLDRCTAGFGCRNQLRTDILGELPMCTGSDSLDYRGAWEV
jgi:hypothetical protein